MKIGNNNSISLNATAYESPICFFIYSHSHASRFIRHLKLRHCAHLTHICFMPLFCYHEAQNINEKSHKQWDQQ